MIITTFNINIYDLNYAGAQPVGVCYGLNGNNLPSNLDAINLYKATKK